MRLRKQIIFLAMALLLLMALTSCGDKATEPKTEKVTIPTITPNGGTYSSVTIVTISCPTEGSQIRYTTDGSEPTLSSLVYISPINITQTTTIKAKAFKDGWNPSATATATFNITVAGVVATPTFNPPAGEYSVPQSISLYCTTPGVAVYYTTDNSEPTQSSTQFTSPILVSTTTTIKAKAFKDGWNPSATASATYTINVVAPEGMVYVQGGTFTMGTNQLSLYEQPIHSVTVSSIFMAKYETTQNEWKEIMEGNPNGIATWPSYNNEIANIPVERVTWYQTFVFLNRKSIQENLTPCYSKNGVTDPDQWGTDLGTEFTCNWQANGYRLPTEAEWEFAARGGVEFTQYLPYAGSIYPDGVAWYNNNSDGKTHAVGQKTPNELGLYDMSGNVDEWCWDWFALYQSGDQMNPIGPSTGTNRITRGGAFYWGENQAQIRKRNNSAPGTPMKYIGFRYVRNAN
ncbi:MAG: SUMF1/EgtB/PvdO family nonheme iron enzyme [Candidatus Cloacimonadales bacterium]|jgi:formylglycine-generating enzyme required for sulfatase activity|nr:SUMF1/EgtB/PvdO family nonheme iron enzyme [Candidatus Cloacimonadota bacterium]MDD2650231.1 SUMF1/EgtB/PvdO family nonheme iron enzyme [Candidatus Cloacimonadota bacterium]MDX9977897.1 SUMF1/EgtB/PvdO family nonheme iron enzyme [Candidatus Cloacimonadales bacterium]